jgi:EAL domain-containing protein (putative c-di-GMP-specific phosphodiesterase class I)
MDDLRAAIEAGQLELHYQPQIEIATRRVVAAEALVRWPRARSGNVPPDQFIPLAEVTGLVQPLTTWVLATALRRCRLWQDAGLALTVSVNLSPRSLQDAQLAGEVGSMLREFGVPPSSLVLEITESGIVADPERALEIAGALGRMGVRLAIDDFGTGYTSLAFLTRLPVDEIKIDKSFVIGMTSPEDAVIVRSTIDLGHDLGLRVVAEGVETAEALEALAALRCDRAQGLHIGRPMAADDFESWLRESPMGRGTARPLDTPGATP